MKALGLLAMGACDIIVAVVIGAAVIAVIATAIYKKVKHKGGCGCGCEGCSHCDNCGGKK